MPLTDEQAAEKVAELKQVRQDEKTRLDKIHRYLRDDPESRTLEGLPTGTPPELQRLARLSRVNMLKFIVSSRVQSLFLDGFRAPRADTDNETWEVWQRNGMDARQIGVHRAAFSYGASYVTVMPGEPVPVMRGSSPRDLTAVYGADDEWPVWALERQRARSGEVWRLLDSTHRYTVRYPKDSDKPDTIENAEHGAKNLNGAPIVPVVRFRDTDDLDDPVTGIVEPFIPLQDQINITTFGLLVAQHYSAFKQRYVIGWLAETEETRLKASASLLMTFEDDTVKVGEFGQTDLSGYIDSREATLKHLATVSQTPAHELIGELVNLSAEALSAAEASKRRAITENQTVMGEAHEQALGLAGTYMGVEYDPLAYVRWRDTEARSLAQLVDALGKAVTLLGIPPQALWDRVADAMGVSNQELESWKALAAQGDAFAGLEQMLDRQAAPPQEVPA